MKFFFAFKSLFLILSDKLLFELIEPYERRFECVSNFLRELAPHLKGRLVPIDDPFGPTIVEPDIQLLVVSPESARGGAKINEIRDSKEFPPLLIHTIELYEDTHKQNSHEEDKISSSSQRIRILGDRLKPPVIWYC